MKVLKEINHCTHRNERDKSPIGQWLYHLSFIQRISELIEVQGGLLSKKETESLKKEADYVSLDSFPNLVTERHMPKSDFHLAIKVVVHEKYFQMDKDIKPFLIERLKECSMPLMDAEPYNSLVIVILQWETLTDLYEYTLEDSDD